MGPTDPGGTTQQNGTRYGIPESNAMLQKHQQLSQLLSSTTSSSMPNNTASPITNQQQSVANLAASLANISNANKSHLVTSLTSPSPGMNKTVPTSSIPHSMNSDIISSTAYSGVTTSANNISAMAGMPNILNMQRLHPQQGGMNTSQAGMRVSDLFEPFSYKEKVKVDWKYLAELIMKMLKFIFEAFVQSVITVSFWTFAFAFI